MISALTKQEDGTIKLTITLPIQDVKKTWEEVVNEMAKQVSLPGFRKGKAPKKLVEEKIDKTKVRDEVLKKLLPQGYLEAVKEHDLKPIISPRIYVSQIDEKNEKDWQFEALTCEMPVADLGYYKQNVQKITAKTKIIVPGGRQELKLEEIIKALLDSVVIKIPQILIDQEVERLLSQTLDDIKKLGLTLNQYLTSTGKTPETLRKESEEKAKNDLVLEFALQKIAEEEKITVEEKEVEEAIQKAKDENERKTMEANRYLLASILRQQKTLDFLKNL